VSSVAEIVLDLPQRARRTQSKRNRERAQIHRPFIPLNPPLFSAVSAPPWRIRSICPLSWGLCLATPGICRVGPMACRVCGARRGARRVRTTHQLPSVGVNRRSSVGCISRPIPCPRCSRFHASTLQRGVPPPAAPPLDASRTPLHALFPLVTSHGSSVQSSQPDTPDQPATNELEAEATCVDVERSKEVDATR
jgi:hypothetical protein